MLMFSTNNNSLRKKVLDLELAIDTIQLQHNNEKEKLILKHQIELDEVKHLVKLKEEKLDIEHEKEKLKLQEDYKNKELQLQREHHDKIIANIEKAQEDLKGLYSEIMKRLPQISVGIKERINHG